MNVRENFHLAWPLALNALLVQSMVMVDVLMVASLGEGPVAALGIATTLTAFLMGIQFALANGTQLILARAVGRGDAGFVQQHLLVGLQINLLMSLLFSGVLLAGSGWFLVQLGIPPHVTDMAMTYLTVMAGVILASAISQVIIVLFNAHRQTRVPLQGLFLEVPVNIAVSYLCIYGIGFFPELGVAGAAWGSFVAILVRTVYLSVRLWRSDIAVSVDSVWRVQAAAICQHLQDAGPIAANYITLSLGMMVFQLLFARLPVTEYAAIVLVLPWLRMGGQVSTAWAQATSIHIGQLVGRGDTLLIQKFASGVLRVTVLVALGLAVLYIGYAMGVPYIYPAQTSTVLVLIQSLAPVYVLLTFFRTVNTTCGQALRAFGDSGYVLVTHASTQWLAAIPLCALLLYWQVPVVWVFAMLLLEEVLKTGPFVGRLKHTLNALS